MEVGTHFGEVVLRGVISELGIIVEFISQEDLEMFLRFLCPAMKITHLLNIPVDSKL